jgi:hypothetical protein
MAAHFKWYPSSEEVVVPWNARYSFPSQANKAVKITPRIPPKNGAIFTPGQVIRLEFPAQGYVNPINTTLAFDVTLSNYATVGTTANTGTSVVRFQNNIQSLFSRVRIMYGSTPLEDIINYNQIVRNLTEWTATNQNHTVDQLSIAEGIGGHIHSASRATTTVSDVNVRQKRIQGMDGVTSLDASVTAARFGFVPNSSANGTGLNSPSTTRCCSKRYQVNLACGLLTQDKLLPVKFMASQLAIEITLEQAAACIFAVAGNGSGASPTYAVNNVTLIPEILEFDASYDAMFLRGLQEGGVPIKFSSWHTFQFAAGGATGVNLQVQERSRSVKALFCIQNRSPSTIDTDSHATFIGSSDNSFMTSYQWRIGGRYFPASPVQGYLGNDATVANGACEAFVELQKALNVVGDYRLSTTVTTTRWGAPQLAAVHEADFQLDGYYSTAGTGALVANSAQTAPFVGGVGSACYCAAIDLETSNGVEISGLNAEEQSDIAFIGQWTAAASSGYNLTVFTYYDAMLILRENNVLELIQ